MAWVAEGWRPTCAFSTVLDVFYCVDTFYGVERFSIVLGALRRSILSWVVAFRRILCGLLNGGRRVFIPLVLDVSHGVVRFLRC